MDFLYKTSYMYINEFIYINEDFIAIEFWV